MTMKIYFCEDYHLQKVSSETHEQKRKKERKKEQKKERKKELRSWSKKMNEAGKAASILAMELGRYALFKNEEWSLLCS